MSVQFVGYPPQHSMFASPFFFPPTTNETHCPLLSLLMDFQCEDMYFAILTVLSFEHTIINKKITRY